MKLGMLPFNITLARVDEATTSLMRPVTSLDFYERVNGDLHEDGLFSVLIFGRLGDEMRDRRFSYIDIKVEIFHPVIYQTLIKVKALYRGILSGTQFARWDETISDFVPSTEIEGKTGFAFFVEHFKDIKFKKNKSNIRDKRIQMLEKYRDRALTSRILVIPAGLRDIEVDESGQKKVGEINTHYRKMLATARAIPNTEFKDSDLYNLPRHILQMTFNEIYETLEKMLRGKKGFFQHRWGRRRIFNGTRNVITAMDTSKDVLDDPHSPKFTDSIIGIYQAVKAFQPLAIHGIRNKYLTKIFNSVNLTANLIEPVTLKNVQVDLDSVTYDKWMSVEGLEKILTAFGEVSMRHKPILLNGYYLALIYAPRGTNIFKVFHSIDELPEGFNPEYVRPINYIEFIYLSCYEVLKNKVAFITRYPITGIGSIYPCTLYIKTTVTGERRYELDDNWSKTENSLLVPEFPLIDASTYIDSLVVHSSRLNKLGADFDGDTASCNGIMTDEGIEEVMAAFRKKEAWVDPRGGMIASANVDTVALVLKNMTR